jgi:hypothetical protein
MIKPPAVHRHEAFELLSVDSHFAAVIQQVFRTIGFIQSQKSICRFRLHKLNGVRLNFNKVKIAIDLAI